MFSKKAPMNRLNVRKTIILSACLLMIGLVISLFPDPIKIKKTIPLNQALAGLEGWKQNGVFLIDERIVRELKLDDYANQNYTKGVDTVSLYIGHYFTARKVGAAHDPLVCFPGQGWHLMEKGEGEFVLKRNKRERIEYATMTILKGQEKQLVIYWFQSFDETSSNTLKQKLKSMWTRLSKKRGDNAFVRIMIPYGDSSKEQLVAKAEDFVEVFYPAFLSYVKDARET
jgi:EpsI family protein